MEELDENQRKIVRELIKDTRISDNKIAKNTGIPVMTVNRKRKLLEEKNLLRYYTSFDTGIYGLGKFKAKELFIIKFKLGITKDMFIDKVEMEKKMMPFFADYISSSYLGEKDGHLALIVVLAAETDRELTEEFNGKIVPFIRQKLGQDVIKEVTTVSINTSLRRHHNYLPLINMEKGKMKKDWPDDWIFVDKDLTR